MQHFYNNYDFVFYSGYEQKILIYLGECCNQINIQSDGPSSLWDTSFGDYEKNGNDSNVYHNMMGWTTFIFKSSDGLWTVCTKYQCILLKSLIPILFYINVYQCQTHLHGLYIEYQG